MKTLKVNSLSQASYNFIIILSLILLSIVFLSIVSPGIVFSESIDCSGTINKTELQKLEIQLADSHFSNIKSSDLSKDKDLVCGLLDLRLSSTHPKVAPRAEKMLLLNTSYDEVRTALLEDVSSVQRLGLASIILSNLDLVDGNFSNQLRSKAEETVQSISQQKSSDSSSQQYVERLNSLLSSK